MRLFLLKILHIIFRFFEAKIRDSLIAEKLTSYYIESQF